MSYDGSRRYLMTGPVLTNLRHYYWWENGDLRQRVEPQSSAWVTPRGHLLSAPFGERPHPDDVALVDRLGPGEGWPQ